jgi:hypothetical protein
MRQVSSNLTLALKLFFPIFWLVFFGLLTLSSWVLSGNYRLGITAFFLSGVALLYFTLWKLHRVEMDGENVFVTNYFKSVRYPWRDVEKVEQLRFFTFYISYLTLKAPGSFGRRIAFLASQSRWKAFLNEFPEAAEKVIGL